MKPVFADTFYWIAITNPKDSSHQRVLELYGTSLGSQTIVTTDEVLTEFLTFFSSNSHFRLVAALAVQDILEDNSVVVLPQSRSSFLSGLELYQARPDKGYSLTDCISMQSMRRNGLEEVLTNDRHFEQEGFRVLLRET